MRRRAFGKMVTWLAVFALLVPASGTSAASRGDDVDRNEPVLEWNQIFVDTLIAVLGGQRERPLEQPPRTYQSITQARADRNDARVWVACTIRASST